MKTLADFKRDAASGKIKLEMVERYGKTGEEIPERCNVENFESVACTFEDLRCTSDIERVQSVDNAGKIQNCIIAFRRIF